MMSEVFPGAPYPDNCRACNDSVIRSPSGVVELKGTHATFGFACERGHRWKCTFKLDPVWSRMLLQRQPGAFRDLARTINDTDNASLRGSLAHPPEGMLMRMAVQTLVELWNRAAWQRDATAEERSAIDSAINRLDAALGEIAGRTQQSGTEVEELA